MVKAVVGANWGDEGKGKITDMLAKESDIIVRFQGGIHCHQVCSMDIRPASLVMVSHWMCRVFSQRYSL